MTNDDLPTWDLPRSRRRASPIDVWVRGILLSLLMLYGLCLYLIYIDKPLPSVTDRNHFAARIQQFNDSVKALKRARQAPLTVIFIGTSRIKNVAMDTSKVIQAAQAVNIKRPVVSTHLAINWGGYERLQEAVRQVGDLRPDFVVVMPELLYEDFTLSGRARIAFQYLQQKIKLHEHVIFDSAREFEQSVCHGFEITAQARAELHAAWMRPHPKGPGPQAAAATLNELALSGTSVQIIEVPTHPELTRIRGNKVNYQALLAGHGLDKVANIRLDPGGFNIPADAYCDFSHIAPEKAHIWLQTLFERIIEVAEAKNRPAIGTAAISD